jgi:hypothetical protein
MGEADLWAIRQVCVTKRKVGEAGNCCIIVGTHQYFVKGRRGYPTYNCSSLSHQ